MRRIVLAMAAAAFSLAAAAGFAAEKPRVEVAFVLDSTGSMGGLIEGAKQKIWSIANEIIARTGPGGTRPEVRIGIVTYRDRGDEYVTRRFDLTADIDNVFKDLQSITADGGGDTPESVNQALYEAVNYLSWTNEGSVLRIIFLVGDCPPHMDYSDDVKYPVTARQAALRGIIIDTVQCGEVPETTPIWKEIARMADGSFVALAQSGNMTAMATPFDDEIARTSREIGSTVVAYGDRARQDAAREKVAAAAGVPAAVAADRAEYNLASGGKAIQGYGDLVADAKDGAVDIAKLRRDELPPKLQRMSVAERTAYIAKQQAKREALNAKLDQLARKRADYIDKERARLAESGAGDAFDTKVSEIISAQAARVRFISR